MKSNCVVVSVLIGLLNFCNISIADIKPVPDTNFTETENQPRKLTANIELYSGCIVVKDVENIQRCSVPRIVRVINPCKDSCDKYVYIEVCIPQDKCYIELRVGKKVKLVFIDSSIVITSKNGVITVDYND